MSPASIQSPPDSPSPATRRDRPHSWAVIAAALVFYLLALNVLRDKVPAGLNNDVAEEALRGVLLLEQGRIEPLKLDAVTPAGYRFGQSMETLFLYILGVSTLIFGTTAMAIHVSTWLFALATVWLVGRLARHIEPSLPPWLAPLLAISSVWLYHYARSGLRAITAPVFFLAFTLLLDRTERSVPRPGAGLLCGAMLGLSLYGYTSCRVLPVAFGIHALLSLRRAGVDRRDLLRRYGALAAGALVVSVPNLLFLLRQPDAFLSRGAYVVRGDLFAGGLNILRTLLLPFHYPSYRTAVGPANAFDGVSIGLTVAGLRPVHPIVAAAFLLGLARAWKLRKEPAMAYLLVAWLTGTLALGISGPSLTRMLILLPFYLVVAALGFGTLFRIRRAPAIIAALLLLLTAVEARDYFVTFARDPSSQREYRPVATSVGLRARSLAAEGTQVICVVAGNANVINYLNYDHHERVQVFEFVRPPADTHDIPLMLQFRPRVILLERAPGLDLFRAAFLLIGATEPRAGFDEITVQSAAADGPGPAESKLPPGALRVGTVAKEHGTPSRSGAAGNPGEGQRHADVGGVREVRHVLGEGEAVDQPPAQAAQAEARLELVRLELVDGRVADRALAGVKLQDRVRVAGHPDLVRRRQRRDHDLLQRHTEHLPVRAHDTRTEIDRLAREFSLQRGLQSVVVGSGRKEQPLASPGDLDGPVEDEPPPRA